MTPANSTLVLKIDTTEVKQIILFESAVYLYRIITSNKVLRDLLSLKTTRHFYYASCVRQSCTRR